MFFPKSFILAFVAACTSGFLALPQADIPTTTGPVFPDITPGPGLPSIASLNLTLADLYKPIPEEIFEGSFPSPS